MKRTHIASQHDAHVELWGLQWKPWQAADIEELSKLPGVVMLTEEDRYVISKSDSIENLYWGIDTGNEVYGPEDAHIYEIYGWVPLSGATFYTRAEIDHNREPVDGFWMPAERAEEIERMGEAT